MQIYSICIVFLALCEKCVENSKRDKTTGVVSKPILSLNFNRRAQMDLIDFQSLPDGKSMCQVFLQINLKLSQCAK
jgi:hypothetical protein